MTDSDAGNYRCTASNNLGIAHHIINVTVKGLQLFHRYLVEVKNVLSPNLAKERQEVTRFHVHTKYLPESISIGVHFTSLCLFNVYEPQRLHTGSVLLET